MDLLFLLLGTNNLLQHLRVISPLVYLDAACGVVVTQFDTMFIQYIGTICAMAYSCSDPLYSRVLSTEQKSHYVFSERRCPDRP